MSDEQKIWTFGEAVDKVRQETSLNEDDPDEEFVTFAEIIGFFNEGIDEAEGEIMGLNQDYFLAYDYMPLVEGQSEYDYPLNIYANKFRGIIFNSDGIRYVVHKYKHYQKFENIEEDQAEDDGQEYRYFPVNNRPGERKMVLVPAARETSVLAPLSPVSTHIRRWYIRNANRIPLVGDYTNREDILPASVDTGTNVITVDPTYPYVTGDQVKLSITGTSTLPSPLAAGTVYYVIAVSDTTIKLATSASNARLGTEINLTTTGTGFFTLKVAATEAIIRATVIDIPEFTQFIMEWVKANCLFKDGDPRIAGVVAKLEQQRKMMQDTLAEAEPDDDDVIAMDLSAYQEMS